MHRLWQKHKAGSRADILGLGFPPLRFLHDAGGTGEWHHYLHHQEELTDAGDDFDVGHVAS